MLEGIGICHSIVNFQVKILSYFDEESRERFIPHIVETSVGVTG